MGSWIKHTVLFASWCLVVLVLLWTSMLWWMQQETKQHVPTGQIQVVFLGDSHFHLAIQDECIGKEVKNISANSETFHFMLPKLKSWLSYHPETRVVYAACGWHNFSPYYYEEVIDVPEHDIHARLSAMMSWQDQVNWIGRNVPRWPSAMQTLVQEVLHQSDDLGPWGGYGNPYQEVCAVDSSVDKRIAFQYTRKPWDVRAQADWESLVEYCRESQITLIPVMTPVSERYRQGVPTVYVENWKRVTSGMSAWDDSALLQDSSLFIPDGDHLSEKGAQAYSTVWKERVHALLQ
jgi:hypothetical protein